MARMIENGSRYTEEFKKIVVETYNLKNKGKSKCAVNAVASSFGLSPTTLQDWLGRKAPSMAEAIRARLKDDVITYKGKVYRVSSTLPTGKNSATLRNEGKELVKQFNAISISVLSDMGNNTEYYRTTARLLRTFVFGDLVVTQFKASCKIPNNIWDSKLATKEKLQQRNDKLKELIEWINEGEIVSYRQLLLELRP
jgi:transposase-like protein